MSGDPSAPVRTILRVRRRRNAVTASTLRLDGLLDGRNKRTRDEEEGEDVGLLDIEAMQRMPPPSPRQPAIKRAALWRRLSVSSAAPHQRAVNPNRNGDPSIRVVDAVLQEETEEGADGDEREFKKRRLKLLDEADTISMSTLNVDSRKPRAYRVLNPDERMVDDSLRRVHAQELAASHHLHYVLHDPTLAPDAHRRWLTWSNGDSGNLLHACAACNDVETASELLALKLPQILVDQVDGDGNTPYEVAQLCKHANVCQVLEAYGADTSNYVMDVYCLADEQEQERTADASQQQMECTLTGGVGYWDDEGLFFLVNENKAVAEDEEDDEDPDEDSNDENWTGNDYPDDDGMASDSDDDLPDHAFRRAHANIRENDDDADYDAAYGIATAGDEEYDSEC